MTQLSKAVVLVTGATGGFGKELTRQLLELGSQLILTDLDAGHLAKMASAIAQTPSPQSSPQSRSKSPNGKILGCLTADLSSRQGCDRLYTQVKSLCQEQNIEVDVVINNAGIALYGRMDEVPQDRWEMLMQINLLSPMRLSTLFAADMIRRRRGHIVNISSIAGWIVPPGLAHYSASKFGLRGFSEGLYNELAPYNVKVTVVFPYFSRTPILDSARYGTLAEANELSLDDNATDPAQIMAATIRAVQREQLEVFPDASANGIQTLRRLFPKLSNWVMCRMSPG
ncbi:MAG: SDR family NAD(P)-dependent oxidoreductase [Cyanobacteria bacterium P01_F01_bin.150]